jgi:hypothetical protein
MRSVFMLIAISALTSALTGCLSQKVQRSTPSDSQAANEKSSIAPSTDVTDESSAPTSVSKVQYNVPVPTSAEGTFAIRNFGIARLAIKKSVATTPAIHLQLIVENKIAMAPWTIDTRAQQLKIENEAPLRPAFARSISEKLPFVTIAAGARQTIDLYYILPTGVRDPGDVQKLSLNWQLITDEKVLNNVTSFTEISREPNATIVNSLTPDSRETNKNYRAAPGSISGTSTSAALSADSSRGAPLAKPQPIVGENWWEDPFVNVGEPWKDSLR